MKALLLKLAAKIIEKYGFVFYGINHDGDFIVRVMSGKKGEIEIFDVVTASVAPEVFRSLATEVELAHKENNGKIVRMDLWQKH